MMIKKKKKQWGEEEEIRKSWQQLSFSGSYSFFSFPFDSWLGKSLFSHSKVKFHYNQVVTQLSLMNGNLLVLNISDNLIHFK